MSYGTPCLAIEPSLEPPAGKPVPKSENIDGRTYSLHDDI